jgi:hypothetical protein
MLNRQLFKQPVHVTIHPLTQLLQEFTMTSYIPALIWSLSCVVCLIIAKRRHVKQTAFRAMVAILLGPVAIPFVIAAKPQSFN